MLGEELPFAGNALPFMECFPTPALAGEASALAGEASTLTGYCPALAGDASTLAGAASTLASEAPPLEDCVALEPRLNKFIFVRYLDDDVPDIDDVSSRDAVDARVDEVGARVDEVGPRADDTTSPAGARAWVEEATGGTASDPVAGPSAVEVAAPSMTMGAAPSSALLAIGTDGFPCGYAVARVDALDDCV